MNETALDYRSLFEQSPDVLLVLLPDSPRFTIVAATESRLAITLTTREQNVGRGVFELFPDNPDEVDATGTGNLRASLERVLATREPDTMAVQKYDIRDADGRFQTRFWSPRNLPVLSETGEVRYILHRVEDVTELARASEIGDELRDRSRTMEREVVARSRELDAANRRLREANARLGELDAAKTEFFSNISHEFRTPLTLMLGPLEDSLRDALEPLGAGQRERIGLALSNAQRLLKLVNALLDVARAEAGHLRGAFAPHDLAALTKEVVGMFPSAAEKAGLLLQTDCSPLTEPAWVDRDMWEKVVSNLVSNALKFTLAGSVTVRLFETETHAVLEVADTGVGIPPAELARIFDRFHRVAGSRGRSSEGSGIGLSLVRELVAVHGGSVQARSVLGEGSVFRVEIPRGHAHLPAAALQEKAAERGERPLRDVRGYASEAAHWQARPSAVVESPRSVAAATVLLVEDNPDLREYVRGVLAPEYAVVMAGDGEMGLQAALAQPPDVVLSDVMMPNLDGFGLLRALRANPRTATLPVILLSARAGEEAAIAGLDAGADDYLAKPFSARELLARVRTNVLMAQARRAWTEELERANRELDAFSYSVSHDLRAPLRAIDGFRGVLQEDYGAVLGAGGGELLGRIQKATNRMTELIDDLLALARASRGDLLAEAVNLTAMAEEIVAELRQGERERAVEVRIGSGLTAHGDPRLMRVVLANLLGNAWKFTRRTEAARIDFDAAPDAEATFYVRDNGAGFDMAGAGELFAPFKRLHAAAEFEGTGVGLAIVERVIRRHLGRVWAASAVGEGTTIYFALPPSVAD